MHRTRYYKPIDGGSFFFSLPKKDIPEGDVGRAHAVGMVCEATGHATKKKTITVGSFGMPATRARLTRVPGIDQLQGDALGRQLVPGVELGLRVGPARMRQFLPRINPWVSLPELS